MRTTALIIAMLAGSPVFGATANVTAGEHGDFTRVVVQSKALRGWDFEQNGKSGVLTLKGDLEGIETTRVYDRIQRERLQSVETDGLTLRLDLECNCTVKAYSQGGDLVVLDITDEPLSPQTTAQVDFAPSRPDPALNHWADSLAATEMLVDDAAIDMPHLGTPDPALLGQNSSESLPTVMAKPKAQEPAPQQMAQPLEPRPLPLVVESKREVPDEIAPFVDGFVPTGQAALDPELSIDNGRLNELESRLAQQIGTATTQGVLSPAPGAFIQDPNAEKKKKNMRYSSDASVDALFPEEGDLPPNIRFSSSIDSGDEQLENAIATNEGLDCSLAENFDVTSWGDDDGFAANISSLRERLYGEFDAIDRDVQVELARAYLYYGFGAEALQVASIHSNDEPVDASLFAMGKIMEYGPDSETERLAEFATCDNQLALWAILSRDEIPASTVINSAAALRTLSDYPFHLRQFLAPELSDRFRKRGETALAEHALRTLERTGTAPDAATTMEYAEIAQSTGDEDAATEHLEEVVESNTMESPEALIRYIDLRIAEGKSVSGEMALLAEAYSAEHRTSELGTDLKRVHILALAKSHQYEAAFAKLEAADGEALDVDLIMDRLLEVMHAEANDVTFLKHAMAIPAEEAKRVSAPVRLHIADRLVSLGFAASADTMIADIEADVAPRDQRLLRGQIALSIGHPEEALEAAEAFDGPEFDQLRADALYAAGQFEAAAEAYEVIGDTAMAEKAVWSANLGEVASEDPMLERIAGLADKDLPEGAAGPLSHADALLNDASTLAEDISSLLSEEGLTLSN